MYCYSLWIRGNAFVPNRFERIRVLTGLFNESRSNAYFFMSFYGKYRKRLDALSNFCLKKADFMTFAQAIEISVSEKNMLLSEIDPVELMKRAEFAREHGFLDQDTDVLARFGLCDFGFCRKQYRNYNRNKHLLLKEHWDIMDEQIIHYPAGCFCLRIQNGARERK